MKKRNIGVFLAFSLAFGAIAISYIKINNLEKKVYDGVARRDLNYGGFKAGDVFSRDIAVFNLSGSELRSSNLFNVKKTFAIFFSTECPICLQDAPMWEELYEKFEAKGLNFLGLSVSPTNGPIATKQFIEYSRLKFPVVLVPVTEIHKVYTSFLVPEIVIFDSRGVADTAWIGDLAARNNLSKVDNYLRFQR